MAYLIFVETHFELNLSTKHYVKIIVMKDEKVKLHLWVVLLQNIAVSVDLKLFSSFTLCRQTDAFEWL